MSDHLEKWKAYCEARLNQENMKALATEAWSAFKLAEAQLVDALLEADPPLRSVPDACGATASMRASFSISCNKDNEQDVEEWLREDTGDAEPFKVTKLDKAAVRAHVKKEVEDNGVAMDSFPDFLNVDSRPTISVAGWEKKKAELIS